MEMPNIACGSAKQELVCSDPVLSVPLTCDASLVGAGTVMSYWLPLGSETLNTIEREWARVPKLCYSEREVLTLMMFFIIISMISNDNVDIRLEGVILWMAHWTGTQESWVQFLAQPQAFYATLVT